MEYKDIAFKTPKEAIETINDKSLILMKHAPIQHKVHTQLCEYRGIQFNFDTFTFFETNDGKLQIADGYRSLNNTPKHSHYFSTSLINIPNNIIRAFSYFYSKDMVEMSTVGRNDTTLEENFNYLMEYTKEIIDRMFDNLPSDIAEAIEEYENSKFNVEFEDRIMELRIVIKSINDLKDNI